MDKGVGRLVADRAEYGFRINFPDEMQGRWRWWMAADLDGIINHKGDRMMIIDMGPADGRVRDQVSFLRKKQKWGTHRALIF